LHQHPFGAFEAGKALFHGLNDGRLLQRGAWQGNQHRGDGFTQVGMGQTDLRYRPEFRAWKFVVTCDVDSDALTEADVINLVNRAGFGVGIGEWRPEKGGEYGRFAIDTTVPMEIL
jgi:hypothetical protein